MRIGVKSELKINSILILINYRFLYNFMKKNYQMN